MVCIVIPRSSSDFLVSGPSSGSSTPR